MQAETDQLLLEMKLVDLSNELERLQAKEQLSALERARSLIAISREIRAVSCALRGGDRRTSAWRRGAHFDAQDKFNSPAAAIAAE